MVKENLPLLQEVVDSNAPRNSWPMGKVVLALPDKYGLVRQVKVKTSNVLTRPIDKLCKLSSLGKISGINTELAM